MLSLVESNLKVVKLFAQHGSTFPLFRGHPCVAQQSRVHLHYNALYWEFKHIEHFIIGSHEKSTPEKNRKMGVLINEFAY